MVSLSNHVAISLRLNTRWQTAVATATRLPPPYQVRGRNDRLKRVRVSALHALTPEPRLGRRQTHAATCGAAVSQSDPRFRGQQTIYNKVGGW